MKISRHLLLWGLTVGAAVTAGSAAVAAAGPRSEVLTPAQISADLAQAQASATPQRIRSTLKPGEFSGGLPSASITARCVGSLMEVTDWSQAGPTSARELRPGPADTVSLNYVIDGSLRVAATGRCVKGLPTGSYTLGDEPAQQILFGTWVDIGLTGCKASSGRTAPDPDHCHRLPIMVLSAVPPLMARSIPPSPH